MQGDLQDLYPHNSPLSVDYGRITTYLYSALKKSIEYIEKLKNDAQALSSDTSRVINDNEEMKSIIIDLQNDIIDMKNEIINLRNILNNKLVII